ncbi:hypothetical protein NLM33_37575 [Bradyrhizobium sp. CCGUVB1N3]|uniref:hypothetical protein n=1 Tax=Bradyrhizobium sp. CCGUVB1N3 TaxID=2949629 RepID=UPI0020B3B066|nr:hypothetical protein [Bradyrhizobium sp. CCGUVB1N3]MCP3475952.1 hypothetical protein [Bradyrhizobium sp. CCGUVB1N3]
MATILNFPQLDPGRSEQDRSHSEASEVMSLAASLLSKIHSEGIRTANDLRDVIVFLERANACIRLLIGRIESGATRKRLEAQSRRIDQLIATTRMNATHLF